jgi:hypothetical protein
MDGGQVLSNQSLGLIPTGFNIIETRGDYNDDGKDDTLWRNSANGEAVVWQMNGANVAIVESLGFVPLNVSVTATLLDPLQGTVGVGRLVGIVLIRTCFQSCLAS